MSFLHGKNIYFLFIGYCIVVGKSRKDCNTGLTRGESRASPGISPQIKNQLNIIVAMKPRIRY